MRKIGFPFLFLFVCLLTFIIINAKNQILFSPQPDLALNSVIQASGKSTQLETTQLADFNPTPTLVNFASLPVADTPTPSPSPLATAQPTPTPKPPIASSPKPPTPTSTPEVIAVSIQMPPGSLDGDKILSLINDYRKSKGLSNLQKDDRSCQLAASRAPEIMHEVETGTMHSGLAARNLPYWDNENIAYYDTEEETVNWWISDTIHRQQLEGDFKYSCVECYHNSCAQELTNFTPK